jgi:hypothetical protein
MNDQQTEQFTAEQVERIAIHCFGWKWMAWPGRPIKSHPEYATGSKIMVRTFLSPEQQQRLETEPNWVDFWERTGHVAVEATGDEPLAYCYCSSRGYSWPEFTDLDVRDWVIANWMPRTRIRQRFDSAITSMFEYREGDFVRAVLIALDNEGEPVHHRFNDEMKSKMPRPVFGCADIDCSQQTSYEPTQLRWSEELRGWYCERCLKGHGADRSRFTLDDLQREVGWTN